MINLQRSNYFKQSCSSEEPGSRVSVIIPTYNRSSLITTALKSLQAQSFREFEIIVVDDGSSDDTEQVVKSFADPRLIYIQHEKNRGGASARNTGILAASGEFIAFLDSDDQWMPEKLEKQLKVFEMDDEIGAVYTGVNAMDGQHLIWQEIPEYRGDMTRHLLTRNCIGTTSSVMIKRKLLLDCEGFDEHLPSCQDWDLFIRLSKITKWSYVKEALVSFEHHSGERISTNNLSVINGHLLIFKKHGLWAKEQGTQQYGEFSLSISKILLKNGVFSRNKNTVKKARAVLREAFSFEIYSPQHFLLYILTFVYLPLLNTLYWFSKKRAVHFIRFFQSVSYPKTYGKTSI